MKFVHIGFQNLVNQSRIVSVEPLIMNITERGGREIFREKGLLLDMTYGRVTQSVIIMDSGHRILSAQSPEEIKERMAGEGTSTSGPTVERDKATASNYEIRELHNFHGKIGRSFVVLDLKKNDYVRGPDGQIVTRDTIPEAARVKWAAVQRAG